MTRVLSAPANILLGIAGISVVLLLVGLYILLTPEPWLPKLRLAERRFI